MLSNVRRALPVVGFVLVSTPAFAVTYDRSITMDFANTYLGSFGYTYSNGGFQAFDAISLQAGDTLNLHVDLGGERLSLAGAYGGIQFTFSPSSYPGFSFHLTTSTTTYEGVEGSLPVNPTTRQATNFYNLFASTENPLADPAGFSFSSLLVSMLYSGDGTFISGVEGKAFASGLTLAAVPLPAGISLLGAGLAALVSLGWRKNKRSSVAVTA